MRKKKKATSKAVVEPKRDFDYGVNIEQLGEAYRRRYKAIMIVAINESTAMAKLTKELSVLDAEAKRSI